MGNPLEPMSSPLPPHLQPALLPAWLRKIPARYWDPRIVGLAAIVMFSLGFVGGLWHVGFWDKYYYLDSILHPSQKRLREQTESLRKLFMEVDAWSIKQKKWEKELDERANRLHQAENDLSLQKGALEELNRQINVMREQLDARLLLVEAAQETNNKKLSKIYSDMSAEGAAKILVTVPDVQVAQVFLLMKENRSAKILEVWATQGGQAAEKAVRVIALMRIAIRPPTEENIP